MAQADGRPAAALPGSRGMRSYRWQTTFQNADSAGLVVIAQHNENPLQLP